MSYLLDTPVFSEYTKKRPDEKVFEWMAAQAEEGLYTSVLTVGEIAKGIERLAVGKRKVELGEWLEQLIHRFDQRLLLLDTKIMRRWAIVTATAESTGRVLPIVDSLIAATALEHNLTVVTRNTADYAGTGAMVLDIWS